MQHNIAMAKRWHVLKIRGVSRMKIKEYLLMAGVVCLLFVTGCSSSSSGGGNNNPPPPQGPTIYIAGYQFTPPTTSNYWTITPTSTTSTSLFASYVDPVVYAIAASDGSV